MQVIFSSGLGSVEKHTPDAAVKSIANHVRRMQEELEYRLAHLDSSNIREIDADETEIRGGPIALISQTQGDIAQLKLTDRQIEAGVQGLGGQISQLRQTAGSLTATVEQQGQSISALEQTADSLTATVQSLDGDVSTLRQTADSLTATVEQQGQSISTLQQTSGSLTATVESLGKSMSQTVRIAADGVTITNAAGSTLTIDGGQVNADTLNLTGKIAFTDLDSETQAAISNNDVKTYLESIGITEIDNGSVKAPLIEGGEIRGAEIYGGIFSDLEEDNYLQMQSTSDPEYNLYSRLLTHYVGDADSSVPLTTMGWFSMEGESQWVLAVLGSIILKRVGSVTKASGVWDFSGATVIGL